MRRSLFKQKTILIATFAVVFAGSALFAPQAHASVVSTLVDFTVGSLDGIIAGIMNIALWVMHWFVVFAGAMLNVSINLTLHIADFVNSTQGVYLVWQTVRDLSGLFIIFALLYCSFLLILNQTSKGFGSVGNLIKNIVIAGILINFSFFIVSLLIDASNIVSLAIYNGILGTPQTTSAPAGTNISEQVNGMVGGTSSRIGLGDIFMNKLKLQTAYAPSSLDLGNASSPTPAPLKTLLQGIVGIVIMFTAAMSFLLAALAFAARLIILIILLAFSPLLFASWIFPILKDKSAHYTDVLKGQLIFMPIYLILLYAAMTIITNTTIFNVTATSTMQGSVAGAGWIPKDLIVLAINDFFIIFLLNLPLVTAFGFAGSSAKWLEGGLKRFNAETVWQNVGRWTGNRAYQNTISRGASAIGRSEGLKNWASRSQIGEYALKGVQGTASSYDKRLAGQVKSRTEFAEALGYDKNRVRFHETEIRDLERQQSILRSRGDKVGADALDSRIAAVKTLAEQAKEQRKASFAGRTATKQADTIWMKIARKDKIAAATLQKEILGKQFEEAKKDLEKTREKIKNSLNTIESLQRQIDSGDSKDPVKAANSIRDLESKLRTMYIKEKGAIDKVDRLDAMMAPYENVS